MRGFNEEFKEVLISALKRVCNRMAHELDASARIFEYTISFIRYYQWKAKNNGTSTSVHEKETAASLLTIDPRTCNARNSNENPPLGLKNTSEKMVL